MKSFATTKTIRADRKVIWRLLTDASGYPSWNTTVDRVDGTIALGERITVHAKISPGRAFPVRVAELVPEERMVWRGGMPLGLFVGERTFTLEERGDGSVEFAMREEFRGLMAPLITRSIPDLQPAFEELAEALRRRAEAEGGGA